MATKKTHKIASILPFMGSFLCLIAAWAWGRHQDWLRVVVYLTGSLVLGILSAAVMVCDTYNKHFKRIEHLLSEFGNKSNHKKDLEIAEHATKVQGSNELVK